MATIRQTQSTYAITISTFQQHRHFQRTANAELFIAILFQHRDQDRFQLHGFVVMPDHVHVLITPAIDQSTAKCVQYIKGAYSFAVRSQSPGEIWHSGYRDHRIRDADDFNNQLRYIANNPSRKRYEDYPISTPGILSALTQCQTACFSSRAKAYPQGLKPRSYGNDERAKPEGLAYLEATTSITMQSISSFHR